MFNYLKDTVLDYINKLGTKNLVINKDLRTRVRLVTRGAKLSPDKILQCIVESTELSIDLGYAFKIKKQINCSCSAFYGKILTFNGFFCINSKEFLNKYSKTPIQGLFQKLEIPLNFPVKTKLKCPDSKCKGKILNEYYEFESEPLNFTLSIEWDSNPEPLEILRILMAIQPFINLSSKLNSTQGQNFSVKGLVLQKSSGDYIYCTTLNSEFYIIEDTKYFKIVGGDWVDSIYNFAIHSYKPVVILYCASDIPLFKGIELDDMDTLEATTAMQAGVYKDWKCLCCESGNLAEDDFCKICKIQKQSPVKDWECKCGFINPAPSTICSFCCRFRFDYYTGKCGVCAKDKIGKECIHCNIVECFDLKCMRKLLFGQQMYHQKCGKLSAGYCGTCRESMNSSNSLCFICFDQKYCFCKLCEKLHLKIMNCQMQLQINCSMCYNNSDSLTKYCKECRIPLKPNPICIFCKSNIFKIIVCVDCFTALTN